jgi:hypothetical protein
MPRLSAISVPHILFRLANISTIRRRVGSESALNTFARRSVLICFDELDFFPTTI